MEVCRGCKGNGANILRKLYSFFCYCRTSKPLGNTCRTLILILAVFRNSSYGAHSAPWSLRCGGRVPARMRGTPWYARRHEGPDMITVSPDRSKMATGSVSLVVPPMRNTAVFPSLAEISTILFDPQHARYGDKGGGCADFGTVYMGHERVLRSLESFREMNGVYLFLVKVDDSSIGFWDMSAMFLHKRRMYRMSLPKYANLDHGRPIRCRLDRTPCPTAHSSLPACRHHAEKDLPVLFPW